METIYQDPAIIATMLAIIYEFIARKIKTKRSRSLVKFVFRIISKILDGLIKDKAKVPNTNFTTFHEIDEIVTYKK